MDLRPVMSGVPLRLGTLFLLAGARAADGACGAVRRRHGAGLRPRRHRRQDPSPVGAVGEGGPRRSSSRGSREPIRAAAPSSASPWPRTVTSCGSSTSPTTWPARTRSKTTRDSARRTRRTSRSSRPDFRDGGSVWRVAARGLCGRSHLLYRAGPRGTVDRPRGPSRHIRRGHGRELAELGIPKRP